MTLCAYWISIGMVLYYTNDANWQKWVGLGVAAVSLFIGVVKERILTKKIRELGGDRV